MRIFFTTTKDGRVQVDVDDLEGWEGFEALVDLICRRYEARVLARHDGPDARSWTLEIEGHEVLLQHDDMYGHFFFAKEARGDELVRRMGEQLSTSLS
jgi:hypothetical protein